jgi:adenosine deaminase
VAKKGICVEYNPTSNVLISNMKRYDAHPVCKYRKTKGVVKMKVAIGTDDKGVFATSLYNEYALLAAAVMKKKRRMGFPEWYDKHVAEYFKEIADASLQNRF